MLEPVTARAAVPSVTLIVPVHNGESYLCACPQRLRALDPPADQSIIVDDGSCDRSRELARQPGFSVVLFRKRSGSAQARATWARGRHAATCPFC